MAEVDIVRECGEERDAFADQDGDAGDRDVLNQAGAEEALDGDASVDVGVVGAGGGEFGDDFFGRAGHLFDLASADCGEVDRLAAEDDDALVAVRPGSHREDGFESLAADDDGVDAGDEFVVAVGLASAFGEEVESAVGAGDEAVKAGADEDGSFRGDPSGAEALLLFSDSRGAESAALPRYSWAEAAPFKQKPKAKSSCARLDSRGRAEGGPRAAVPTSVSRRSLHQHLSR